MDISLAKPLSDKRKQAQVKREHRKQFDPSLQSSDRFGYQPQGQFKDNRPPMSGNFGNDTSFGMDSGPSNFPNYSYSQLHIFECFSLG